ncbi:hypothetical protein ACET3Z_007743 [Daucus carota]
MDDIEMQLAEMDIANEENEELTFDEGVEEEPRRAAGGVKSRWLREDSDGEWGRQAKTVFSNTDNQGIQNPDSSRVDRPTRVNREDTTVFTDISGNSKSRVINLEHKEGNSNVAGFDGPDSDEHYGLNLEDRKRQRSEAQVTGAQTKNLHTINKESMLSGSDCMETTPTFLAKLATQASQSQ